MVKGPSTLVLDSSIAENRPYGWFMTTDTDLTDEALRQEIELVGELVLAASACRGRMRQEQVDELLGVRCA